jgi:hypothetical protein
LQYSKPNLPRNPDWEGYGKTTKNIFGVGRDQRLARQISWTLPGGFGQTAISVSIAEISKRSSARATTIYSSAAISRRSGLAPGANSIAMTLGRPLASPGFARLFRGQEISGDGMGRPPLKPWQPLTGA